jgi:hypothetical protein
VPPCFPLHLPLQQRQPSTVCSATGPPSARQGPPCSPPPPPLWRYRMRPLPQPWDRCVAAGLPFAGAREHFESAVVLRNHFNMPWFCVAFQCWCRRTVASPAARALLWTHFFLELGQAAAPCLQPCGCPTARGGQQVRVSSGGRVFLIPCTIHRLLVCVALLVAGAEAVAALPTGSTHLCLGASGIVIVHNDGFVSCVYVCASGRWVAAPKGFT